MNMIEEAFKELYPNKEFTYQAKIKYSGKFSAYNANVKYTHSILEFSLSRLWKEVSREIRIGLIQSLMLKVFKDKNKTTNIDLYRLFLKNVSKVAPKTESHPTLDESFYRVNESYFFSLMQKPNLVWGEKSKNTLGRYDYGSDTIRVSSIFKKGPGEFLDYIMYHELLHKKLKFTNSGSRSRYHTTEFRKKEREFKDQEMIEKRIKLFASKKKLFSLFEF